VNRRTLLSNAGLALAGLGLGACAPRTVARTNVPVPPPPRRPPVQLPLVRVSHDRVIRATVGLRPHRPSGFVLKPARLDAKTVIHNYGHGGSGMSLSWGTGAMAADLALAHPERRAAVLGGGVVGLTTARQLQRRGFAVTIYAAHVPPDVTSNWSLAAWTPTSGLVEFPKRTPEWNAQLVQAAEIAYRQLQFMASPKYGISWITNYNPTESAESARGTNALLPPHLQSEQTLLQPGEHPFPTTYAIERPEMRIEPNIYLDALMHDVLAFGGQIVIRTFETPRDVLALSENVVVNCTGLGARTLFGDDELTPLKGLLVLLPPQDEVHYSTSGGVNIPESQRGLFIHMMPRRDGIVLGGTSERGVATTDVNEAEKKRIVDNHVQLFASMKAPAGFGSTTSAGRR
jgi:D-amino-acid oxidase